METAPKKVCLANLAESSKQEVFDWVTYNLIKQGEQSVKGNDCLYRKDNLRCEAGWLLDDEDYSETLEGKPWDVLVLEYQVPNTHAELIYALQAIHDGEEVVIWPEEFKRLAEVNNLTYNRWEK